MKSKVILRYKEGLNFESSDIDGFIVKIKNHKITIENIKQIRDELEENGYNVENFNLKRGDEFTIEGGLESMPSVDSISDLLEAVRSEETTFMKILNKMNFIEIEITLFLSGLY